MNGSTGLQALVFDAYGTLFDVHSVIALCDQLFPDQGARLSQLWRAKQLEYTWLRSLMGRYEDFWQVTEDALVFAARDLKLDLDSKRRTRLMSAYLELKAWPDVAQALKSLKAAGIRLGRLAPAFWKGVGDRCFECGGCAFVCPTCWCFNVADVAAPGEAPFDEQSDGLRPMVPGGALEPRADGDWERVRMRDCCNLAGFIRQRHAPQRLARAVIDIRQNLDVLGIKLRPVLDCFVGQPL